MVTHRARGAASHHIPACAMDCWPRLTDAVERDDPGGFVDAVMDAFPDAGLCGLIASWTDDEVDELFARVARYGRGLPGTYRVASLLLHPDGLFNPTVVDPRVPAEDAPLCHWVLSALLRNHVPMGHWCERGEPTTLVAAPGPKHVRWNRPKGVSVGLLRAVLYHELRDFIECQMFLADLDDRPPSLLGRVDRADLLAYIRHPVTPLVADLRHWFRLAAATPGLQRIAYGRTFRWLFASTHEDVEVMAAIGVVYEPASALWVFPLRK